MDRTAGQLHRKERSLDRWRWIDGERRAGLIAGKGRWIDGRWIDGERRAGLIAGKGRWIDDERRSGLIVRKSRWIDDVEKICGRTLDLPNSRTLFVSRFGPPARPQPDAKDPASIDRSTFPCDQAGPPFAIDPSSTIQRPFPAMKPARRSIHRPFPANDASPPFAIDPTSTIQRPFLAMKPAVVRHRPFPAMKPVRRSCDEASRRSP
jgi:hypothetical protein